ncbi:MAG: c-type cytochrome [Lysobacterales bacterium]
MDQQDDRAFLRQFSGIIVGLFLLTVALIFVARWMQPDPDADANPSQRILAEQRILPVGAVRSGEEGAAALADAQAAAVAAQPAAEDVVVDAEAVYAGLCKVCHEAGVAGAPITNSEQMTVRLDEKGLDTLVSNAINGLNAMPPRGGNPALTDEQVRAAVEFMLP